LVFIDECDSASSLSVLWNTLRNVDISSSLKVWKISAVSPSGPGAFLCVRWFIAASSSLLIIDPFQ
jgi:hypothetical protein